MNRIFRVLGLGAGGGGTDRSPQQMKAIEGKTRRLRLVDALSLAAGDPDLFSRCLPRGWTASGHKSGFDTVVEVRNGSRLVTAATIGAMGATLTTLGPQGIYDPELDTVTGAEALMREALRQQEVDRWRAEMRQTGRRRYTGLPGPARPTARRKKDRQTE